MDPLKRNRLRREKIEKNRQRFRIKVETFYKSFIQTNEITEIYYFVNIALIQRV